MVRYIDSWSNYSRQIPWIFSGKSCEILWYDQLDVPFLIIYSSKKTQLQDQPGPNPMNKFLGRFFHSTINWRFRTFLSFMSQTESDITTRVGFKDVFSFTSKLGQILSTSLECKFTIKTGGSKKLAPKIWPAFFKLFTVTASWGSCVMLIRWVEVNFWRILVGFQSNKHPSRLICLCDSPTLFTEAAWHGGDMLGGTCINLQGFASQNFRKYHPWAQHLARSTHNGLWWMLHRMP